jgi:hypothetical protein
MADTCVIEEDHTPLGGENVQECGIPVIHGSPEAREQYQGWGRARNTEIAIGVDRRLSLDTEDLAQAAGRARRYPAAIAPFATMLDTPAGLVPLVTGFG